MPITSSGNQSTKAPPKNSPRILLIDIETLPNIGFTWGKYEQTVIDYQQEFCIATYAAKWYMGGRVFAGALPDYKGYSPWSYDDKNLVADIHALLDSADIVVAHNGDSFDVKVINSRFIFHKLKPPAPYKTIDTKKMAKGVARFNSNKLDDLGKHLGEGKKIKTDFSLWFGCMSGDIASWNRMVRYNKQDVLLLEKIYNRLRPYAKQHPNIGAFLNKPTCPKCGGVNVQSRGYAITTQRRYQRYQCTDCGGWMRSVLHGQRNTNLVQVG